MTDAANNIAARYAADLYRSRNWHDQREYEARFVRAINEGIAAATASMEREIERLRRIEEAAREIRTYDDHTGPTWAALSEALESNDPQAKQTKG